MVAYTNTKTAEPPYQGHHKQKFKAKPKDVMLHLLILTQEVPAGGIKDQTMKRMKLSASSEEKMLYSIW